MKSIRLQSVILIATFLPSLYLILLALVRGSFRLEALITAASDSETAAMSHSPHLRSHCLSGSCIHGGSSDFRGNRSVHQGGPYETSHPSGGSGRGHGQGPARGQVQPTGDLPTITMTPNAAPPTTWSPAQTSLFIDAIAQLNTDTVVLAASGMTITVVDPTAQAQPEGILVAAAATGTVSGYLGEGAGPLQARPSNPPAAVPAWTTTTAEEDVTASTDISFSNVLGEAGLTDSTAAATNPAAPTNSISSYPTGSTPSAAITPEVPESLTLPPTISAAAPTGADSPPYSGTLSTWLSSVAYSQVTADGYTSWVESTEAISTTSETVFAGSSATPPAAAVPTFTASPSLALSSIAASTSTSAPTIRPTSPILDPLPPTTTKNSSHHKLTVALAISIPILVFLLAILIPSLYWLYRRRSEKGLADDLERSAEWLTPNRSPVATPQGSRMLMPTTPTASDPALTPLSKARIALRDDGGGGSPRVGIRRSSESRRHRLGWGMGDSQIGLTLTSSNNQSNDEDPFGDTGMSYKEAMDEYIRLREWSAQSNSPGGGTSEMTMIDLRPAGSSMGDNNSPERRGSTDRLLLPNGMPLIHSRMEDPRKKKGLGIGLRKLRRGMKGLNSS